MENLPHAEEPQKEEGIHPLEAFLRSGSANMPRASLVELGRDYLSTAYSPDEEKPDSKTLFALVDEVRRDVRKAA